MEEEKELKMYVVTQRVSRKGIVHALDIDHAKSLLEGVPAAVRWDTFDIKTESIEEFNPLKSNEEVEKYEA